MPVALHKESRWLALVVLCAGMLMIILDQTIVNVALPSIQTDLGYSPAGLAWVVNAYLIAYAGLLLLSGRLGDLIGRKRVLMTGLAAFTAASLLCGVSVSQEMLIVARFLQGVGGAMVSGLILGMIVTTFPDAKEQARAIGVFSFVAAAGGSIGLLAGGVLTEALNWHWIFFVNLPIGIAALVLSQRLIPSDPGIGLGAGADAIGATLITAALMLGVYAIVGIAEPDRSAEQTAILGTLGVLSLIGFLVRQATAEHALMPLSIFRSRTLSGANLVQILMVAGMFGMFFLGTLYLQRVLGYSAMQIGLAFMPVAVAIGGLSIEISARLTTRFGGRAVLLPSLVSIFVGLLLFARAPVEGQYVLDVLPVMLLIGIGGGLAFPALTTLAMADATPSNAGLVSGVVNTASQVGGALGLAVLATLSSAQTQGLLDQGADPLVALTDGYHLAFKVGAALVLCAIVVAVFVLDSDRGETSSASVEHAGFANERVENAE